MSAALALQHLFHETHGFFIAPGAGQLDGGGPLRVEILRCVARPDEGGIQRRLIGSQVFGYTERPLGDACILCRMRLLDVVTQRDVEAVALACQLGHQKRIQRVFAERARSGL